MYSSTLFFILALEGGEGSASRPGRTLPPGKARYALYWRLGGPQGQSGRVRKISPPTRIRSPDRPACRQSPYQLRTLPSPRTPTVLQRNGPFTQLDILKLFYHL